MKKVEKKVLYSRLANREKPLFIADIKVIKEYVDNEFNPDNQESHCALYSGAIYYWIKIIELKIDKKYKSKGRPKFLKSTGPNWNCSIYEVVPSMVCDISATTAAKKKREEPKETMTSSNKKGMLSLMYPRCRHNCR